MKRIALIAVLAASLLAPAVSQAATAVGSFRAGSGNYLTSGGTDNLRQVGGSVTFTQTGTGPITVNGTLTGLAPSTPYVTVPYKDAVCAPAVGVTAFPSGSFFTNAQGVASPRNVTLNPQAINPVGSFSVNQTASVSVRQVLISAIALPGIPAGTPNVPNGAAVEACDRTPVVTP